MNDKLNLTIYAKKRTSNDGRTFYTYLTTLHNKNGMELRAQVKFREEAGQPKGDQCPCNIIVNKRDANLSKREYRVQVPTGESDENGEAIMKEDIRTSHELWVSKWVAGEAFVDHSLDDYE